MLYQNGSFTFSITPEDIPNSGILFANLEKDQRSGHLGHAMVEYAPGKILDFFPDCDGKPLDGHSSDGWMDFCRSEDGGETWSEPMPFPYSKNLYDMKAGVTAFSEKAICADNGDILVFNVLCLLAENRGNAWEPYLMPNCVISPDGGRTWRQPIVVCEEPARIYDVTKRDGNIYVFLQVSKDPCRLESEYRMYISRDHGAHFEYLSTLPFLRGYRNHLFYGTMAWLPDGALLAYAYNDADEHELPYSISRDCGKHWSAVETAHFAKRIRNPQLIRFKNSYFIFGRSGSYGGHESNHNIVYASPDGIHWDGGQYLALRKPLCEATGSGWAAYSNTLAVHCRTAPNACCIKPRMPMTATAPMFCIGGSTPPKPNKYPMNTRTPPGSLNFSDGVFSVGEKELRWRDSGISHSKSCARSASDRNADSGCPSWWWSA